METKKLKPFWSTRYSEVVYKVSEKTTTIPGRTYTTTARYVLPNVARSEGYNESYIAANTSTNNPAGMPETRIIGPATSHTTPPTTNVNVTYRRENGEVWTEGANSWKTYAISLPHLREEIAALGEHVGKPLHKVPVNLVARCSALNAKVEAYNEYRGEKHAISLAWKPKEYETTGPLTRENVETLVEALTALESEVKTYWHKRHSPGCREERERMAEIAALRKKLENLA